MYQTIQPVKKDGLSHQQMKVLEAFLQGHIITIGDQNYRYAEKDELLFSDETHDFAATESGLYFETPVGTFENGEEKSLGSKWMLYTDSFKAITSKIAEMTEDEVFIAISNKSLTDINSRERA